MHQIVPYLTSVCKTLEGSRILLVDDPQSSLREPKHDVKIGETYIPKNQHVLVVQDIRVLVLAT